MSIIDKYRIKASEIEYDFIQNDRTHKDVLNEVVIDLFDELEEELESEKMSLKRELLLTEALIHGDKMRKLIKILPVISNSFRQKDNFDEYVYFDTQIELSLTDIVNLNEANFNVDICKDIVVIV